MIKIICGVDPGKHGAIALLDAHKHIEVYAMPKEESDLNFLFGDFNPYNFICYIESIHSSPQMGVASAFTFGYGYGLLMGMLHAHGIPYIKVQPQKWQRGLSCLTKGDKKVTLKKAREIFPDNKEINIDNADSVLIAEYGRRHQILLEAQK